MDETRETADDPTTPGTPDPALDLIEECLLRMELEGPAVVDELCRRNPEHAEELREAIGYLRGQEMLESEDRGAPEVLGEFALKRRLGGGGMGVVYLAEQQSMGRDVAVKLVRPELVFFAGSRARFQREVEATARLQHPGIVPVYAVGEQDGIPYFAMEYIEGASLASVVSELAGRQPESLSETDLSEAVARACGKRPETQPFVGAWWEIVTQMVLEVARAVAHAHQRGVLHRDIKPSNVMLSLSGRVQLVDFGLARSEGDAALTMSGSTIGSLAYMSPEQVEGAREMGVTTDVYSLGVTLYELLTLRCPYMATTAGDLRKLILEGGPRPIREEYRHVPRDLETVCLKAMQTEPTRRYESAAAFARDLGNALAHKPILAKRAGPVDRALRYARRHPARAALTVVLPVAGVIIAILLGVQAANADAVARGREAARKKTVEAQLQRGWLFRQIYPEQSEAAFDAVLALAPDHPLAVLGLIMLGLTQDEGRTALVVLSEHPQVVAKYPSFRLFERFVLERLDRRAEAAELPQLTETPRTPVDQFVTGLFHMVEGDAGEIARYRDAKILFGQAIDMSREAQVVFHLKKLEAASMGGDQETLVRVAAAVETLWPDSAPALAYAGHFLTGYANPRAIQLLERAVAKDGGLALSWLYLATARRYGGQDAAAADAYRRAVAIDPNLAEGWSGLAELLLVVSQGVARTDQARARRLLDEALEAIDRALVILPADEDAHGCLAEIRAARGEPEAAIRAFDRMIELAPRQAWGYFKRGRFRSRNGKYALARADLRAAIERNATVPLMHRELASAARMAGDYREARQAIDKALALQPDDLECLYELAMVQWGGEDHAGAKRTFAQLIRQRPQSAVLHKARSEFLAAIGDSEGLAAERARWAKVGKDR